MSRSSPTTTASGIARLGGSCGEGVAGPRGGDENFRFPHVETGGDRAPRSWVANPPPCPPAIARPRLPRLARAAGAHDGHWKAGAARRRAGVRSVSRGCVRAHRGGAAGTRLVAPPYGSANIDGRGGRDNRPTGGRAHRGPSSGGTNR